MVRRWKQAKRIMEEAAAARRAAGLPEPKWHEDPLLGALATIAISAVLALLIGLVSTALSTVGAVTVGIAIVVLLGAGGQALRGVGEQLQSRSLKAYGYYVGALAYLVTASVALFNGLPRLLAG